MKYKQPKAFLWKILLSVFSLSILSLTGCGKAGTNVPLKTESIDSSSEEYCEKTYPLAPAAQSDDILSNSYITDEQNTDLSASNSASASTAIDSSSHSSKTDAHYQSGELIAMAKAYYEKNSGFLPPEATCTANDDNTYTIQLYEIVDDGDGAYHTATSAWYTVDKSGSGTDDILGTSIQLEALSMPDVLAYMGTPTMLLYAQRSEASTEWEIEDTQVIASCIEALKGMTIGEENEMRCTDSSSLLIFLLKDGSQYALTFEESDLVIDDIRYETEGGFAVLKPLQDYVQELNQ